jgi:hypothetical protein
MRRRALSQYGFHCSHCTASIRKNTDFYRCKPQGIFACYLIRHLTPGSQSTYESAIQSAQNCPADSGFLSECSQLEESRSPSVQKQDGKEDGVSSSVQVETHAFCIEGWNLKKDPNDFKQFDMTSFMTLISDPRFGQFEDGGWSFAFNFHIFALICFQVPPLNQMCKCQIQSESCLQDPAKGRAIHHVMQCVVGKKFIVSRRGPTQFVEENESWISVALSLQEHNERQPKDASQLSWPKGEWVGGRTPMPSGTLRLKLLWGLWYRFDNYLVSILQKSKV